MTLIAPTDVRSISIPEEHGGCGQPHEAGELGDGEHFVVDCPACEPHIAALKGGGWASHLAGVALTPDERREVEQQETKARMEQHRTWGDPNALGASIAAALGAGPVAKGPTLLEQLATATPQELDALRALLAVPTPPPEQEHAVGIENPQLTSTNPDAPAVLIGGGTDPGLDHALGETAKKAAKKTPAKAAVNTPPTE